MILRSNHIHEGDLRDAAAHVGTLTFLKLQDTRGERAHSVYVWEVRLAGSSKNAPRGYAGSKTATYEEWGVFLAYLYEIDPRLKCDSFYKDADDFHEKTEERFRV